MEKHTSSSMADALSYVELDQKRRTTNEEIQGNLSNVRVFPRGEDTLPIKHVSFNPTRSSLVSTISCYSIDSLDYEDNFNQSYEVAMEEEEEEREPQKNRRRAHRLSDKSSSPTAPRKPFRKASMDMVVGVVSQHHHQHREQHQPHMEGKIGLRKPNRKASMDMVLPFNCQAIQESDAVSCQRQKVNTAQGPSDSCCREGTEEAMIISSSESTDADFPIGESRQENEEKVGKPYPRRQTRLLPALKVQLSEMRRSLKQQPLYRNSPSAAAC